MTRFKTLILAACLAVAGPSIAQAVDVPQVQPVGPFAGLNTQDTPEAVDTSQSPDLLNVDINKGGKSVKKRQGYGLDATLFFSTSAVHNLYKFFDSSGNEIRLAFQDVKVSASVNGAAWAVVLTTGITAGATWDCTDYLGFAYCVSSAFDCPIKTNGTSAGTTGVCGTNLVPAGSLVSNSGDRLLVGATAANPSRIYYSASSVFTDFSLGVQSSNSSFEDIVAPGSKLTHMAYHFGRWLWWKDQSFGFIVGTGQFDLNIVTVSNTIGTLDNTDVFDGNFCYFRGSDAQIYTYDGSNLSRAISTDIAPTLRTANRRKANSWTQSSQSDWQTGSSSGTNSLSTQISPGDVVPSSFTKTENSSASGWGSGTASNLTVGTSSMSLTTNNSGTATNPSFESAFSGNWYDTSGGGGLCSQKTTQDAGNCTLNPKSGSNFAFCGDTNSPVYSFEIIDLSSSVLVATAMPATSDCVYRQISVTSATNKGKRVRFRFKDVDNLTTYYFATSDSYIFGGTVSFWYANGNTGSIYLAVDLVENGSSTITSGSFTSQAFNTGMPWSNIYASATWTVNTTTPSFVLQKSANGTSGWLEISASTSVNVQTNMQYLRYISTFTITAGDNAQSAITGVNLLARSSGTYFSSVFNAPLLTSWNTFSATSSDGDGGHNFYIRSSTSPFYVQNSSPPWTAQTSGAIVSASTGTYMQVIDSFTVTSATGTNPVLRDFILNWYEGVAADKMYGTYFFNGIWFSLSLGTSTTTNNRIFRYDLLANVWTIYDIPSNGFLTYNNNLYFGSPTVGKIFQFGNNIYSDNGAAITAYWKSKPFFGDSPFTDKDLRTASWYVVSDSGTTLNLTYTLSQTTNTVTKNIPLSDTRRGVIQNNWNFPSGTSATTFSAKFGDVSSSPSWEVLGGVLTFIPKPWIVSP